jgi:ABC-2 type transport system ATP-binding protein
MIDVEHLTKRYGNHTAVSDLSFHVQKGQVYGFLGPNAAGKSTTMSILTGCLAATSGKVSIGGHDIVEDAMEAKKLIGYLPEQPPLYLDLTPREYLTFVSRAKGVSAQDEEAHMTRAMDRTGIADVQHRLIRNLSKGYRQRVGLAQALIGDPQVIILDEPTVGLDPQQIIEIRDLIKSLGHDRTVILSSHILTEVQAICQTILIISKGKLVACDTPDNLEKLFTKSAVVKLTVEAKKDEALKALRKIDGVTDIEFYGKKKGYCEFEVGSNGDDSVCRDIFFAFAEIGKPIISMATAHASLEDVFIELTKGNTEDAEDDGEARDFEITEDVEEFGESEDLIEPNGIADSAAVNAEDIGEDGDGKEDEAK